jgi:hypothetical protein
MYRSTLHAGAAWTIFNLKKNLTLLLILYVGITIFCNVQFCETVTFCIWRQYHSATYRLVLLYHCGTYLCNVLLCNLPKCNVPSCNVPLSNLPLCLYSHSRISHIGRLTSKTAKDKWSFRLILCAMYYKLTPINRQS